MAHFPIAFPKRDLTGVSGEVSIMKVFVQPGSGNVAKYR
jgi:hypothetical protein